MTPDEVRAIVDRLQLVSIREIAERAGVTDPAVCYWTTRPTFPACVMHRAGVRAWHWPNVHEWLHDTGRI